MNLYIHIPFCRRKCFYCDFYSVEYEEELALAFVDALCRQIQELQGNFSTIFIGGGTPTVLDVEPLEKILKNLRKFKKSVEEFTIEANPESFTKEKADLFINHGVNRLSIGGQGLYSDKLLQLGRVHSVRDIPRVLDIALGAGFKNINLDLIFGVWDQDLDKWKQELEIAVSYPINHISVYALTLEKNTPLFTAVKQRRITPLSGEVTADMYVYANKYLKRKGFFRYEVSNFSKKRHQCRHNLGYWQGNEYVGLGPAAVSFQGGVRKKNISDLAEYIKKVKNNESVGGFKEKLSRIKAAKEFAAVKIRTSQGLDFGLFKNRFGLDFMELEAAALEEGCRQKLVRYKIRKKSKVGVQLTSKGFLFCDTVSSSFL